MANFADATGASGRLWLPPSAAAFGHLGTTPQLQAASLAAHLEVRVETVRSVFRDSIPTLEEVLRYTKSTNTGLRGKGFEYAVFFAIDLGVEDVVAPLGKALEELNVDGADPQAVMVVLDRGKPAATALVGAFEARAGLDPRIVNNKPGPDPRLDEARLGTLHDAYFGRARLPSSIADLAKADLFIGDSQGNRWVGAQLKLDGQRLQPQQGVLLALTADGAATAPGYDPRSGMLVVSIDRRSLFLTTTDNAHFAVEKASSVIKDGGGFTSATIDQWAAMLFRERGEFADAYISDLRRRAGLSDDLWIPSSGLVTAATAVPAEEAVGPVAGVELDLAQNYS